MIFLPLICILALTAEVLCALPVSSYSVHEQRSVFPPGWRQTDELDRSGVIPVRIALAQNNLDKGWAWLREVSHPDSSKYGQHWTAKAVAEAFAPRNESVTSVRQWLVSQGISEDRVAHSQSLGFLEFNATVLEAERLLAAKYHLYRHIATGQKHVACEKYSLPSSLKDHIDFVYPTVHFDAKVKGSKATPARSQPPSKRKELDTSSTGRPMPNSSEPVFGHWLKSKHNIIQSLENCDNQTVPDCLRLLYGIPHNHQTHGNASYGIVEYTPQAYLPSDLDMFFRNFSSRQVGDRPVLDSIDGGVVQSSETFLGINLESDLDLEYSMTLVGQNVTLFQAGDLVEGSSFNNFLDAIDASYCTYDGGDDPSVDDTYPDPYPNGYTGPENCGGFSATQVISSSYTYNEQDLTPAYESRQCHEYMKLGLMGVSVIYSSGDDGVAGSSGDCIDGYGSNATYTDGSYGRFNPAFPPSCPYVTAVGATQVKPNTSLPDAIKHRTQPEQACETQIFSGGGFSNVFPLLDYQSSAVHGWFSNNTPPYGADRFNNTQQTRGFPDISANGANYVVAVDGNFALISGTSASAPTVGSIITLINERRASAGKSSVGFVNPVAYAHPEVFNDVVEGGNPGCGTSGFQSVVGWDPVTGLGTPDFHKMVKLWLSLP